MTVQVICNLKWISGGSLIKHKYVNGPGVYLLVHSGSVNRIIYVGTTINFENRWFEHAEGMKRGNRAIWRVRPDQDIYELMSHRGSKDYFKYYRKLALENKLWASTNVLRLNPKNDLNPEDNFNDSWFDYVVEEFMPRIMLWACRMDSNYESATILESQIQKAISKYFNIGTHINKPDMNWLGKIENLSNANLFFEFLNYPNVDKTTHGLLQNLGSRVNAGIEWKMPKKIQKITKLEKKIARQLHTFAYSKWIYKEDAILTFLITRKASLEDMTRLLQRAPEEIEARIKWLKKWGRIK
ncbi:GIY-YIG nuclease family protein [Desulfosporosinus hippei]|uniref:GIY-YIG catalytic domain-containing protein n=1 Tax=Desulfosporosinus hippei DSM 8344 TaxID=1121419 RepID=A0A1G8FMF5_9FIRM|nr:GIY-YIG nuclease family protein [Desulfosporosinus hippei]SDH83298.1 GIY-YIG catalytic domain-containing protein [Desulfosporosinus hippei DSM 8344]